MDSDSNPETELSISNPERERSIGRILNLILERRGRGVGWRYRKLVGGQREKQTPANDIGAQRQTSVKIELKSRA